MGGGECDTGLKIGKTYTQNGGEGMVHCKKNKFTRFHFQIQEGGSVW